MENNALLRQAARHVVEQGFVTASEIHHFGLTARDVSQSNGVALVECGNGRGFAVKAMRPDSNDQQGSSGRELALYRAIDSIPELQTLAPKLLHVDHPNRLLTLEGLISARTLAHRGGGRQPGDPEIARRLGETLGSLHRESRSVTDALEPTDPWMLHLDRDCSLEILKTDEKLRRVVDRILSSETTKFIPKKVRDSWRSDTIIHGDIRFSNLMVVRSPIDLRLIDWETSGLGDADWDLGAAIQEYLSFGVGCGYDVLDREIPPWVAIMSLMRGYRDSAPFAVSGSHLAPFVACRLLMRAIQLANWKEDPEDDIDRHLNLAAAIGRGDVELTRR